MITDSPLEIRSGYLPNTSPEHTYSYSHQLGPKDYKLNILLLLHNRCIRQAG
jgi:hypothetical protein